MTQALACYGFRLKSASMEILTVASLVSLNTTLVSPITTTLITRAKPLDMVSEVSEETFFKTESVLTVKDRRVTMSTEFWALIMLLLLFKMSDQAEL